MYDSHDVHRSLGITSTGINTPVCQWGIATMSVLCLCEDVLAIYIDTILPNLTNLVGLSHYLQGVFSKHQPVVDSQAFARKLQAIDVRGMFLCGQWLMANLP